MQYSDMNKDGIVFFVDCDQPDVRGSSGVRLANGRKRRAKPNWERGGARRFDRLLFLRKYKKGNTIEWKSLEIRR